MAERIIFETVVVSADSYSCNYGDITTELSYINANGEGTRVQEHLYLNGKYKFYINDRVFTGDGTAHGLDVVNWNGITLYAYTGVGNQYIQINSNFGHSQNNNITFSVGDILKLTVEETPEDEEYLNKRGLQQVIDTIKSWFAGKQDTLVSGTNIKTINNQSLLGSGDITTFDDVFVATYNTTTFSELAPAITSGKSIILKNINNSNLLFDMVVNMSSLGTSGINLKGIVYDQSTVYKVSVTVTTSNAWSNTFEEVLDVATDDDYGLVKLNSSESITLNSNGQLKVGGRMGQFDGTTGMFAPNDRAPRNVNNYSLLVTDAKGMNMPTNRALAVVSGLGIACQSAPAGSTVYRINNTYANRILAKCCENGFASRDEATSTQEQIVQVVSVKINGQTFDPNSAADDSTKPIEITVAKTLNPDSAITNIRLFGTMGSYATAYIGNGVAGASGGRCLLIGGGVTKSGSGNDNCVVGNGMYVSGNGNAMFGRYHIARKNRGFFAGQGHDSTNAQNEGVSAIGQYSYIDANTLFAVGNGSNHTTRLNAFEVLKDSSIVLRSPNGTRFKISVDNSGNLVTTQL